MEELYLLKFKYSHLETLKHLYISSCDCCLYVLSYLKALYRVGAELWRQMNEICWRWRFSRASVYTATISRISQTPSNLLEITRIYQIQTIRWWFHSHPRILKLQFSISWILINSLRKAFWTLIVVKKPQPRIPLVRNSHFVSPFRPLSWCSQIVH